VSGGESASFLKKRTGSPVAKKHLLNARCGNGAANAASKSKSICFFLFTKRRSCFALLCVTSLTACGTSADSSAGPIGGAAVGIGVGGITANPLIGYAAGIGAQAGITALQKFLSRRLHQGEQDNIAATVASLQPGQHAPWQISYKIPINAEHGDVTVTRTITSPLTTCKEVAFTVIEGQKPSAPRGIYITSACAQPDGTWRWAEAEPATARWGFLQ
jgi:surface antigen